MDRLRRTRLATLRLGVDHVRRFGPSRYVNRAKATADDLDSAALIAIALVALTAAAIDLIDIWSRHSHYSRPAIETLSAQDEKLFAQSAQIAARDEWLRLKSFQIDDLRNQFSAIGNYPLSVVWGSDDSAYGLAADVGDACHAAQWSACTPEKLPDSMDVIGMHVHWQAGYQPIAKAIADSLTNVIGVPVKAAPSPEPNLKAPLEVMVGRKAL
jgi:hypothetical protein